MENILATLVAMRTLPNDTAATNTALDYIAGYLSQRGMHIARHTFGGRGALVAGTRPLLTKRAKLMLAAHIDIASGSDAVFTLRKEGNKLKGRGVYDMKFAAAGFMQLVDDLQGRLADYDFMIMFTTDEEFSSRDSSNGTRGLIEAGYRGDVCLLPDSAAPGWDVEELAKGYWHFELIAGGKAAHGSRPWEGESASQKLVRALYELDEHFKNHGPHTDTLNVGILKGGRAFNEVPTLMTAAVDIRLANNESLARNQRYIARLCKKHGLSVRTTKILEPLYHNVTHPLMQEYMSAVEVVTGRKPHGITSLAATDAEFFNAVGIPCIISCPMGGGHHGEDEWVDRKSLSQFLPILHTYAERVARRAIPVDTATAIV